MNEQQNQNPEKEISQKEAVRMFYMTRKGKQLRHFKKTRRIWGSIATVVLCLSLIASILMGTVLFVAGRKIVQGSAMQGVDQKETASGLQELTYSKSSDVSYILVCGLDNKDFNKKDALVTDSAFRTDVIAVACVDHKNNSVNVLQIPRDLFIGTDVSSMKINAVYACAKQGESRINALRRRLASYLGVPIDYYVLFSVTGFMNVVDALGGLEINVWQKDGIYIEDQFTYKQYKIGPGKVTLNGNMAAGFVRKRHGTRAEGYVLGDPDRLEGQRLVYVALARKLMSMSASEMASVAKACMSDVATDMDVDTILGYALFVKKNVSISDIAVWGMPGQQLTCRPIAGAENLSYYSIHKDEYVELWNTYMNPSGTQTLTVDDILIRELHTEVGVEYEQSYFEKGGSLSQIAERFDQ